MKRIVAVCLICVLCLISVVSTGAFEGTAVNEEDRITITFDDVTNFENREKVGKIFENVLKDILRINNIKDNATCLIVGLGNLKSTPDSLEPKVIDNILVTSHLFKYGSVKEGMRKVSTFTPGVMANTGIEFSSTHTILVCVLVLVIT